MTTEYSQPMERPVLMSDDALAAMSGILPAGAMVVGGVRSTEKGDVPPGAAAEPISSGILVIARDDHTIHHIQIDEVKPGHFEIVSDVVAGHW